jgi:hypothetical protein
VGTLGNLGDFAGGLAACVLLIIAIITGPSAWRDWRGVQQAKKKLLDEQANQIRLDRERHHFGWRNGMHAVYGVSNVTNREEMTRAVEELAAGGPCMYAIIRVDESVNRANSLRHLIDNSGYIAQPPTDVEYEALEKNRPPTRDR